MSEVRDRLVDKDGFFDAIAELSVAYRLRKGGRRAPLRPEISRGKFLDVRSEIMGHCVLFEVYRPMGDQRYIGSGPVRVDDDRAMKKALDKVDEQIGRDGSALPPVVLVIDKGSADEITRRGVRNLLDRACSGGPGRPGDGTCSLCAIILMRHETAKSGIRTAGCMFTHAGSEKRVPREALDRIRDAILDRNLENSIDIDL